MHDDNTPPAQDAPATPPALDAPPAPSGASDASPEPAAVFAAAPQPKTNSLAIVALVAGFVVPLAAFICGGIALSQIKRTGDKGRGLAVSGIIVGAVVTVVGAILSILLMIGLSVATSIAADAKAQTGSLSGSAAPGCAELGELVTEINTDITQSARTTGAERAEVIAGVQEQADEMRELAKTIDDTEVAAATRKAATALDAFLIAWGASAGDSADAYGDTADLLQALEDLSPAMEDLETACS